MSAAGLVDMALRAPLGRSAAEIQRRIAAGERAGGANPLFDASTYLTRLAAAIAGEPEPNKNARILSRVALFAWDCTLEVCTRVELPAADRLGIYTAVGGLRAHWNAFMPALQHQEDDLQHAWNNGFRFLHPFWMLQHLSNNLQALLAMHLNAQGEGGTFGGATAGAQALAAASRALAVGAIDTAVVVAYDSLVEPEALVEMAARGASTHAATVAEAVSGYIPAEAAAAAVLRRPGPGLSRIEVWESADGERGHPKPGTLIELAQGRNGGVTLIEGTGLGEPCYQPGNTLDANGHVGAASTLLQLAALQERLANGQSGLALSAAAPGLVAVARLDKQG